MVGRRSGVRKATRQFVKIPSDRRAGCGLLGADENLKGKSLYNTLYGPDRSCRGDAQAKKERITKFLAHTCKTDGYVWCAAKPLSTT